MALRWLPYVILAAVATPVAWVAHLRGSITTNDVALVSVSLSVAVIIFSVYFSLRTAYLYNARNADMTALRHDLNFPSAGAPDNTRRIAAYFLIFSEDYRRRARARTYLALILVYSAFLFVISLVLALAFPGAIYWLSPYFIGIFLFGAAVIARAQNVGIAGPVSLLERMTLTGGSRAPDGRVRSSEFTYPPRYRVVTDQLEIDGLGPFLRELETVPDPKELSREWLAPRAGTPPATAAGGLLK